MRFGEAAKRRRLAFGILRLLSVHSLPFFLGLFSRRFILFLARGLPYRSARRAQRADMRHERFLIAGAAVALMAVACDNATSITGPDAPTALRADVLRDHEVTQDFPWTSPEENPCNGDAVAVTGSTHIVFTSMFNSTGGSFDDGANLHWSVNMSSRGSGVGAPSLINYTVSEQTTDSQQDPEGDQSTQLLEERLLVKASNPRMNYLRHTLFKLTINANGVPTAWFDRSFNKCDGQTIDLETPESVL
jgi:hypothetical protein